MQILKCSAIVILVLMFMGLCGCVGQQQYKDLKVQNEAQRQQIAQLQSELQAAKLQLDQLKRKLGTLEDQGGVEADALRQKIAALEEDLNKKKALIESMQQQLLYGGVQLPVELSSLLEDFANKSDMVTFDAARGIVKFKSDLLFEPGSDIVAPPAADAVSELCEILNTEQAKQFDVIIAGHTDDIPIGRPETRAKHPTNWHLSAHRAISVLYVMRDNGIVPERMSVRGFGEFRPVAPNQANRKGNPKNRRVEIYIVPKGM